MQKMTLGAIGNRVVVRLKDDDGGIYSLSGSNVTTKFVFYKPDESSFTRTARLLTNGTDGIAYYVLLSSEVDVEGVWRVQVYVYKDSKLLKSSVGQFRVDRT